MIAAFGRVLPPVLAARGYREVWLGSLASNAGSWLQIVASGWLVFQLTGSAAAVGVLALMARGPSILLAGPAGRVADRFDRRTVGLATFTLQAVAALALALLTWAGLASVTVIYLLTLALWSGFALGLPAMLALIPLLVPTTQFSQAVTVNAAGINVARLVGPALGGIALFLVGPAWCFLLNALSFAALLLALVRIDPVRPPDPARGVRIGESLRLAFADPAIRRLLIGMSLFTIFASPVQELAPVVAARLDGGELGLGGLLSAMGAGGVLGAVLLERLTARGLRRSSALPLATTAFAVGLGVVAVSPWLSLSLAAMVFCGAWWIWMFSATNTAIQLRSEPRLVGRMLALYQVAVVGGIGVGSVLAGVLADEIGLGPTLVVWAVLLAAWGLWSLLNRVETIDPPASRPAAA